MILASPEATELRRRCRESNICTLGIVFGDFSIEESQAILRQAQAASAAAMDTNDERIAMNKYTSWADALKTNINGAVAVTSQIASEAMEKLCVKKALCFEDAMQHALLNLDIKAPGAEIKKRGLVNQGNTCFQNVIMQSILACPPFLNLLVDISRNVSVHDELASSGSKFRTWRYMIAFIREFEEPTLAQLQQEEKTLAGYHKKQSSAIRIHGYFMEVLSAFQKSRGEEEDALEFLEFLLDYLHSEYEQSGLQLPSSCDMRLKTSNIATCAARVQGLQRESDWAEVDKKGKSKSVRENKVDISQSPINWLFKGSLRSEVKQAGRKQHSVTIEPFHCLHLDLDHHLETMRMHSVPGASYADLVQGTSSVCNLKPVALEEMMKNAFSVESIDMLHGQSSLIKRSSVESLPTVLTINIKRFTYDPEHGPVKLQQAVAYPEKLQFPVQYMSASCRAEYEAQLGQHSLALGSSSIRLPVSPIYRLHAIVSHHGRFVAGGHYTCVCRDNKGQWFHYDDERVTLINEATALAENPYLLFYVWTNDTTPMASPTSDPQPSLQTWSKIPGSKSDNKPSNGVGDKKTSKSTANARSTNTKHVQQVKYRVANK